MKKSLLLSTALVAVFAATQAFAAGDIITGEVNIQILKTKQKKVLIAIMVLFIRLHQQEL